MHISEPADEQLAGPDITLRAGDALPVRIVDVDLPRRRLVLTNRRVVLTNRRVVLTNRRVVLTNRRVVARE
ncbi:hypothetical protein [Streptomyces parvus]|uniref:hypothetical protein n=1 Tax=Streptomyces parvus TaxID=66428 RepID=UPI003645A153